VAYFNRRHRAWGIVREQTPHVTGSFAQGFANVDGTRRFVEQTCRVIQINRGASGVLQYPFSRAQRVEFTRGTAARELPTASSRPPVTSSAPPP